MDAFRRALIPAMVYLGIDPGLNGSLGWAAVRVEVSGDGVRILRVEDAGVIDVNRVGHRVAAGILAAAAERNGVSEVMIEDFLYWNGKAISGENGTGSEENGTRPASRRTVERMQFLIGYLAGFLSARYVPVEVVHPRRWRTRVEPKELTRLDTAISGFPQGKKQHVLSAIGVVLGGLRARF